MQRKVLLQLQQDGLLKNNGNQAEEVRSEEGKVPIAAGLNY